MRKLILIAATLASSAAQAGYFDTEGRSSYSYLYRQDEPRRGRQERYQGAQEQTCVSIPQGDGRSILNCRPRW